LADSPGKRLASFRKSLSMSQRHLGVSLGFSSGLVGQIEADLSPPSRKFLERISERYNVSADWLLHGTGEMLQRGLPGFTGRTAVVEPPEWNRPGHGDMLIDGHDCVRIRRMNLSVSAGSGLAPVEGEDAEPVVLPASWLQRKQINSDLAVLVRVKGDSMAPMIPDGAFVLLNLAEKSVQGSGIYAFSRDGDVFVKRIAASGAGKDGKPAALLLISDNPAGGITALTGQEMNSIRLIGRVRYVMFAL
jgi:phage repressor protein C with HTH and peptisase S24 domain